MAVGVGCDSRHDVEHAGCFGPVRNSINSQCNNAAARGTRLENVELSVGCAMCTRRHDELSLAPPEAMRDLAHMKDYLACGTVQAAALIV
jgi:hypothetical protein